MEKSYSIKLQLADSTVQEVDLRCSRLEADLCSIELSCDKMEPITKTAPDFFSALVSVRKELEAYEIKLLCWGARRDVWPRVIQLDWTGGLTACRLGEDYRYRGAKNIFVYSPPETIATVVEQVLFRDNWSEESRRLKLSNDFPPPSPYVPPWPRTDTVSVAEPALTIGPFLTSHHRSAIDSHAVEEIRHYVVGEIIPLASHGYTDISGRFFSHYDDPRYFSPRSIVKHQYELDIRFGHREYPGVQRFSVTLMHEPESRTFKEKEPPHMHDYPERP